MAMTLGLLREQLQDIKNPLAPIYIDGCKLDTVIMHISRKGRETRVDLWSKERWVDDEDTD